MTNSSSHCTQSKIQAPSSYFNEVVFVQSLSCVWLFATPWTAARQPPLSFINSRNLLRPFNHLILCCPEVVSTFFRSHHSRPFPSLGSNYASHFFLPHSLPGASYLHFPAREPQPAFLVSAWHQHFSERFPHTLSKSEPLHPVPLLLPFNESLSNTMACSILLLNTHIWNYLSHLFACLFLPWNINFMSQRPLNPQCPEKT